MVGRWIVVECVPGIPKDAHARRVQPRLVGLTLPSRAGAGRRVLITNDGSLVRTMGGMIRAAKDVSSDEVG